MSSNNIYDGNRMNVISVLSGPGVHDVCICSSHRTRLKTHTCVLYSCILKNTFCCKTQSLEITTYEQRPCWGYENHLKVTASQTSRVAVHVDVASAAVYSITQNICSYHLWLLKELNILEMFSPFQCLILP